MKQGKSDQALLEFEKTLPGITNKKPVHEKLAIVHDRLGKGRMAEIHQRLADKAEN